MKVNGKMIYHMVKDYIIIVMEINIKGNFNMEKNMVKVYVY